ncbi:MAG: mechanosensitive ion channel [Clostridia bacterium]|nr:mechanosensitive ion channel [Clostridia bacterium]
MAEGSEIVEAADKTVEGSSWDWGVIWTNIADKVISIAGRLLICVVILIVGHFIIKFVTKKILNSKKMAKLDPGVRGFLRTFIKVLLNTILIVSVVGILGIPMASVIAVLGAAGAAIALALQGTLGNLASGIMLVVLRPFRTGDFIEVGGNLGTVLEIGLFATTVVTIDNRHVIIPNSTLTTSTIINYSSEENRRVDMTVTTAYGTDIEKVKEVILDYAKRDSLILDDPEPFVRMTNLNESSIEFTVRMWVKGKDYWDVRFNLSENIYKEFAANNIRIPAKQLDIHVKK